jgi:glycosyltransferase involved in cell wall biosynthesis
MDFLVHSAKPCAYDEEIRALGCRVIPCTKPSRAWSYPGNFLRALATHGPYDVVHSHVHAFSGYVLRLAHRAGVRGRIAHGHSDSRARRRRLPALRRVYLAAALREIRRHATAGLAASPGAAESLFGPFWRAQPGRRVLCYGCDFAPFRQPIDRQAVRNQLGFGPDHLVIGHVGRFCEPKNHVFWIDVAAEAALREPRARFLLVGDGPLRSAVEQRVAQLGLAPRFRFTGVRADVPRLLRGAMDVMLFPSLWEGLPLAIIEAQAAGLCSVVSPAVCEEAIVAEPLVRRLSLQQPAAAWARAALAAAHARPDHSASAGLALMERSPFTIRACVKSLAAIYQDQDSRRQNLQAA